MFYDNLEKFKSENGYEIDGAWYPRVTSIVSIKAKPALYRFYAQQPDFDSAEQIKNRSAQEGSLLHDVIEGILMGQKTETPASLKGAINAFMDFKNQNKIIAHQVENKILSKKHGYAGTIDVLAELNGRLGVLDIKTSKAIYRDYGIQTAAYVEALMEKPSMPPLTRWILRIDQNRNCLRGCGATFREKGGNQKISQPKKINGFDLPGNDSCRHVWGDLQGEVELKELKSQAHDFSAFLASKTLWEWENDYWLKKIG